LSKVREKWKQEIQLPSNQVRRKETIMQENGQA